MQKMPQFVARAYQYLLALLLFAFSAQGSSAAEFFAQGNTQFSLMLGSGYAFNSDYLIAGGGIDYFVLDGLGVGLSYEKWSGTGPTISQTTPSAQYVFALSSSVWPYLGGFYRRTTVEGYPNINSVGGRAGVYFSASPNSIFGLGAVSETLLDCRQPSITRAAQPTRKSASYSHFRFFTQRQSCRPSCTQWLHVRYN